MNNDTARMGAKKVNKTEKAKADEKKLFEQNAKVCELDVGDGATRASVVVPKIAHGYEGIYRRFISGKLIYVPDPNSDTGKIEMPIAALFNPLEGIFDLSKCGNAGQYSSIAVHL